MSYMCTFHVYECSLSVKIYIQLFHFYLQIIYIISYIIIIIIYYYYLTLDNLTIHVGPGGCMNGVKTICI
jgi:hypothetical protein